MKTICLILFIIVGINETFAQVIGGINVADMQNSAIASPETMVCASEFTFQTTTAQPHGLAFDGTYFYCTDIFSPLIHKYTVDGQPAGTIPHPAISLAIYGGDMDFDGTNLWLMAEQAGTLFKLNPVNGAILSSFVITTGQTDPNYYGCAYDNGFVWLTSYDSPDALVRVNATTGVIVDTFSLVGWFLPAKVINDELFIVNVEANPNVLCKIDKSTGAILSEIPLCIPKVVGFTMANNDMWMLSSSFAIGGTQSISRLTTTLSNEIVPNPLATITVYPNPGNNVVILESGEGILGIEIFSISGQKVFSSNYDQIENVAIDVSNLAKGMYIIKIGTAIGISSKKYIKI